MAKTRNLILVLWAFISAIYVVTGGVQTVEGAVSGWQAFGQAARGVLANPYAPISILVVIGIGVLATRYFHPLQIILRNVDDRKSNFISARVVNHDKQHQKRVELVKMLATDADGKSIEIKARKFTRCDELKSGQIKVMEGRSSFEIEYTASSASLRNQQIRFVHIVISLEDTSEISSKKYKIKKNRKQSSVHPIKIETVATLPPTTSDTETISKPKIRRGPTKEEFFAERERWAELGGKIASANPDGIPAMKPARDIMQNVEAAWAKNAELKAMEENRPVPTPVPLGWPFSITAPQYSRMMDILEAAPKARISVVSPMNSIEAINNFAAKLTGMLQEAGFTEMERRTQGTNPLNQFPSGVCIYSTPGKGSEPAINEIRKALSIIGVDCATVTRTVLPADTRGKWDVHIIIAPITPPSSNPDKSASEPEPAS